MTGYWNIYDSLLNLHTFFHINAIENIQATIEYMVTWSIFFPSSYWKMGNVSYIFTQFNNNFIFVYKKYMRLFQWNVFEFSNRCIKSLYLRLSFIILNYFSFEFDYTFYLKYIWIQLIFMMWVESVASFLSKRQQYNQFTALFIIYKVSPAWMQARKFK